LFIVLPKSVEDEDAFQLVVVNRPNCFYFHMDDVYLLKSLAQWHIWAEVDMSALLDKHELSVVSKVLMPLLKVCKDFTSGGEVSHSFVIGTRDVGEDKCPD
jgi:hypothetical protein